jgi:hypothetical protein
VIAESMRDRHPGCIVLVAAMHVESDDLLYNNPMPICLILVVPPFQFNARAPRCTPVAEEKEHFVFRLGAFEMLCWSKDGYGTALADACRVAVAHGE